MARPLRIEYAGAVYHVMARGNARMQIFKGDADRTDIGKHAGLRCATVSLFGMETLESAPRFRDLEGRGRNREELMSTFNQEFRRKTSREWLEILEANGIPCAPINDLEAALTDRSTLALNMVVDIEHKGVGLTFKTPGNPVWTPETKGYRHASPPFLGEHTKEV